MYSKGFELKENCNLFAQCALVKDKGNIDMRTVLESRGGVGKSGVVDKVLKFANTKLLTRVPLDFFVCYVIVAFGCYRNISLKQATKPYTKGKRVPCVLHICDKNNIDNIAISELLSSE